MGIEVIDEQATLPFAPDATIEQVATGFIFTEGALWHSGGSFLLFSDIIGNQMHRWDAHGGVSSFRQPSQMANGNTWDRQGRLLTCEHATSRVTRTERDGSITVLASHYEGLALNSPNDIVVKSDGAIYFTDPIFGRRSPHGVPREPELDHSSVYRIDPATGALRPPDTQARAAERAMLQPGRIADVRERQSTQQTASTPFLRTVPWERERESSSPRFLAEEPGVPDGMKVDMSGHVYCCGPGWHPCPDAGGGRIARNPVSSEVMQLRIWRRGPLHAVCYGMHVRPPHARRGGRQT